MGGFFAGRIQSRVTKVLKLESFTLTSTCLNVMSDIGLRNVIVFWAVFDIDRRSE